MRVDDGWVRADDSALGRTPTVAAPGRHVPRRAPRDLFEAINCIQNHEGVLLEVNAVRWSGTSPGWVGYSVAIGVSSVVVDTDPRFTYAPTGQWPPAGPLIGAVTVQLEL